MQFIPLILAAATATLFNVYAYAKPVMVSSLDSAVPLQLEDETFCDRSKCASHCQSIGYPESRCIAGYVQIPSNKFVLRLTI